MEDWQPRLGAETYLKLKETTWETRDRENDRGWHSLSIKDITASELREQLTYILWEMERISRDFLQAISLPQTSSSLMKFTWKDNLFLLGVSVGVYSHELELPDEYYSSLPMDYGEMSRLLNTSSLFAEDAVFEKDVERVLWSLEGAPTEHKDVLVYRRANIGEVHKVTRKRSLLDAGASGKRSRSRTPL
jgi:hypothetical protein